MIPPSNAIAPQDPLPGGPSKVTRISLSYLPKGVLIGDTVQMVIANIDEGQGMATLEVPEGLKSSEPDSPEDQPDVRDGTPEGPGETAPGGNDTSVLLGPMKGLKNYLNQKSQDVAKNQGR